MVKYKYFGPTIPHVGKTLWEIVGNLKNFGVGRLIVKSTSLKHPHPSFFKIIQIQPLAEPKNKIDNRNVIAWVEEFHRGKKVEIILKKSKNYFPNYILIPKSEEEKYYQLEEKYKNIDTNEIIPKYVKWPPLLKMLYQRKHKLENTPKINTILSTSVLSNTKLGKEESETPTQYCNLYQEEISVDENIKEIVRLQKIVNSYKVNKTEVASENN